MLLTDMKIHIDLIYGSPTNSDENERSLLEYVNELNQCFGKVHDFEQHIFQLINNWMRVRFKPKTKVVFEMGHQVEHFLVQRQKGLCLKLHRPRKELTLLKKG